MATHRRASPSIRSTRRLSASHGEDRSIAVLVRELGEEVAEALRAGARGRSAGSAERHPARAARAQEAPHAPADLRRRHRAVRRARLRQRHGRRDRGQGRRLGEDRLQLLPDQGVARLRQPTRASSAVAGAARARARRVADAGDAAGAERGHSIARRPPRRRSTCFTPLFAEMVESTPALRAAWLEICSAASSRSPPRSSRHARRSTRATPSR
jgi:hypothetical protein